MERPWKKAKSGPPDGSRCIHMHPDRSNAYIDRVLVEELGQGFSVGGPHTAGAEVAWHLRQRPLQLNRQYHQTWPFLHFEWHSLRQLARPNVHQSVSELQQYLV